MVQNHPSLIQIKIGEKNTSFSLFQMLTYLKELSIKQKLTILSNYEC